MTNKGKKLEAPLALDISFGEALTRFVATRPLEVGQQLATRVANIRGTGMEQLIWFKKLSTTDAQQPTTGGLVPYLRLTKGSLKTQDFQTWFREKFFANAPWEPGVFGRESDLEIATISINVMVNGVKFGPRSFTITHGQNRHEKHDTPNTWLHWPPEIQAILQGNDYTNCEVRLTRRESGRFDLEISCG